MTQDRLSNFAIISLENKIANGLDISNVAKDFATKRLAELILFNKY